MYLTNFSFKDNEEVADRIAEQDRKEIKNQIVQLMITVPEKLQLQISDALALIAASDFPEKWENLLPVRTHERSVGFCTHLFD